MAINQDKLNEIFSEALAKGSLEERGRYLAGACGQDLALRLQVDALLEAHVQAGDFLRQSLAPTVSQPSAEGPGTVIGRYKLLQQIGEGGFGIVYMAEQQEPVRRMVALKVIKAGMDTREVVARFEAERQALALMDHPNIARILDGGATASGRPYFVMDLVKGLPITDFCDRNHLSTQARVRLFMKVCAGVQHAHQKGIIHRDLKPTNVLVTVHEGEPEPKVIDFGVAKAIGQKLTERTLFTRFEQLIGTPAYMSPEQAEWSGVDIDTRSDIYSLGVLLYELLTGTTPFDKETLARAALDEVRRMFRETEPPMPSTRLQGLGQRLDEIAQRRHAEPSMLARLVRGDLDWIAMRAIEKDRSRRYETVDALAQDLERHLNGEPVTACPPSKAYRAGKFARRHRVAVAAATGVALALVAGLALALIGFAQARGASRRADLDAATARAVVGFLQNDLLAQADPDNSTNRDLRLREVLDRASDKIRDRFTNQPLVEASIRFTLGSAYNSLGEFDAAEPHVRRALDIRTRTLGRDHLAALDALGLLAALYANQEKRAEAEPLFKQLVDVYQRTLGPTNSATLHALKDLGRNYLYWGRADQAEDILRELVQERRRLEGPSHPDTLQAMVDLSGVYNFSERVTDAAAILEEVLNIEEVLNTARSRPDKDERFIVGVMAQLGEAYVHLGKYPRAAEVLKPAVEFERRVLGSRHREARLVMGWLVSAYGGLGSWTSCVELCRELTSATNDLPGCSHFGLCGAAAALLAGDTNAYREFAARELAQFATTTNQDWARVVGETCLLVPNSVPDLEAVFKLADAVPANSPWRSDNNVKGLAAYRRGNLSEALKWFEAPCGWKSALDCQAGYFCAMIHYRQGDTAKAQAVMEQTAKRLASVFRCGDLGEEWHELGRVAAARAEAERLIFGREVSPPIDAVSLETARRQWAPVRGHLDQAAGLAGQRKWPEARDEFLAAMREPVFDWDAAVNLDTHLASKIGITLLLAGDLQNHEQFCRSLFDHLERFPDPGEGSTALPAYLAREANPTNELGETAAKWAQTFQHHSEGVNAEWASLTRAMAAYRSARYAEAIEESKAAEKSKWLGTRGAAQIFRAMALGKLGRVDEGRQELHASEAHLGRHLANMTGDSWWDLGLCQLALAEAHRLFDGAH